MKLNEILTQLETLGDEEKIKFKEQKFGVTANKALGIYQKDLKEIANQIPKSNQLALDLFDTGIYEARILCAKLFDKNDLTEELMEKWVITFENWEICDTFCMGLFAKSKFAVPKALEWTSRESEFEKRAGFAIIAAYCMADKKASNDVYEKFFPIVIQNATDERIYVKKAISWALRNIGKRNNDLTKKAINVAQQMRQIDNQTASWIGRDVLRELEGEKVNVLDYPRHIYRK
jgi:3-methyladenine DNA glycosylase AlkD